MADRFYTFFRCSLEMTDFKMTSSYNNIREKYVSLSLLSIGENRSSLADCVLQLFKKQWSTLYFEMDNSFKIHESHFQFRKVSLE